MLIEFSFGLIFWMTVSFLTVLFILKKFAWKPILGALSERERTIEDALNEAKKAREEIAAMSSRNEELMRDARESRAKVEADAILSRARIDIQNEKMAAITEMKNQVAELSILVAERILKDKLSENAAQQSLVDKVMTEAELRKS